MFSWGRSFKTGIRYIKRNRFLTLACIFVMSLSFLVSLSFALSLVFTNSLLRSLESKAQVTVFFKTPTPEEEILAIKKDLEASPLLEKVKYVSQVEALKIYLGQHQNNPALLESVSSNILPASLEIKTRNIGSLNEVADKVSQNKSVDEVVFFKDVIESFRRWSLVFKIVGFCLAFLMIAISLLVVLLAVGISVKIRADEIETMRLLGATDVQVTLPFLWQGSFYGFFSSLVSLVALLAVLILTHNYWNFIKTNLDLSPDYPLYLLVIVAHLFFGPGLGTLSGFLAVKKYLRV